MARFYDAKDNVDLARVEALLKKGGIEYYLETLPTGTGIDKQIEVAEEDVPKSEELLLQASAKK